MIDETHDPSRSSWVGSANVQGCEFPIQNLPFGVFRTGPAEAGRVGIAIGDRILDISAAHEKGVFDGACRSTAEACIGSTLNGLLGRHADEWRVFRRRVSDLLATEARAADREALARCFVEQAEAELLVPIAIGDYTDFYASIHHATNVGRMMRPDNPLLPNYRWVPIGYHGRASSIVASGTPVIRPLGQVRPEGADAPTFGPSRRLDYELELGIVIGGANELGTPVPIGEARRRIFGLCLVNDWSARDVQAWEYQPLGPFLAKSFATTVSPWIVTADALEPFRVAVAPREPDEPEPLPYLNSVDERQRGAYAIDLEVYLSSALMRTKGLAPMRVSQSNARDLYWTLGQLVTHHASNGCNLRPGDLIASGTVSGAAPEARACLLERTWRGTEPLVLPSGEARRFLEDGDEVVLKARASSPGAATIGFGECRGVIDPARPSRPVPASTP